MEGAIKVSKFFVIGFVLFIVARVSLIGTVEVGQVGVRHSNVGGVLEEDLEPGWHLESVGLHRIWSLPTQYQFLTYTGNEALEIRTKDNNIVTIDISVPYRIKPGHAYEIVKAGNHIGDGAGGFRFQRLMHDTTVGVLRENLADLKSSDFYDTERRLAVGEETLATLNGKLESLHLEAQGVLLRAAYFRGEYEQQLARIQLNEQSKLLDGASKSVADKQQTLDNYLQQTRAMAAAKEQDWARRLADVERAYEVGFISGIDETPGSVRRVLDALPEEERTGLIATAAEVLEKEPDQMNDAYLLGIKNIQAETLEYSNRVRAEADGVGQRLGAEGDALVAEVNGAYETRVNSLFDSPAGRAFVAWQAAANVNFAETLTFQSDDGIPSVLRLRSFAKQFMND